MRYAGTATPAADFRLTATSELPGAGVAVTPGTLGAGDRQREPGLRGRGDSRRRQAGRYDVTLTARLANGQARAGTGTLTVLPGAAGGPAARLRLTTSCPGACRRGSPAEGDRRPDRGQQGGTARVQLFQGRGKRAKATKRLRLRVPGPIKVVLKSGR